MHSSRSFSSGLHHSVSSSESLPGSPTHSLSPGPSTPCRSPAPDHQALGELISMVLKSPNEISVFWPAVVAAKHLLLVTEFLKQSSKLMCVLTTLFQTIPLRARPLPPARPVRPPLTSDPALSTAWAPSSARSASPRSAAANPPATSRRRRSPAPPHPPPSPSPRSAPLPPCPASPKPCTRTTAKLCLRPPS